MKPHSKRHILNLKGKTETAMVWAIVSSLPDFSVAWHINKQLSINLKQAAPIQINLQAVQKNNHQPDLFETDEQSRDKSEYYAFHFYDNSIYTHYYLIVNKGKDDYLIPQEKELNYFFEVKTNNSKQLKKITEKLQQIEEFRFVHHHFSESLIESMQLSINERQQIKDYEHLDKN